MADEAGWLKTGSAFAVIKMLPKKAAHKQKTRRAKDAGRVSGLTGRVLCEHGTRQEIVSLRSAANLYRIPDKLRGQAQQHRCPLLRLLRKDGCQL